MRLADALPSPTDTLTSSASRMTLSFPRLMRPLKFTVAVFSVVQAVSPSSGDVFVTWTCAAAL
jgi:hypothetical protein